MRAVFVYRNFLNPESALWFFLFFNMEKKMYDLLSIRERNMRKADMGLQIAESVLSNSGSTEVALQLRQHGMNDLLVPILQTEAGQRLCKGFVKGLKTLSDRNKGN